MIQDFLNTITNPNTKDCYARCLRDLPESKTDISAFFSKSGSREAYASIANLGLSSSVTTQRISALRNFGRYLVENGIIPFNGFELLRNPKQTASPPKYISREEIKVCLDAISKSPSISHRDALLFRTLYCTGLRVSELAALRVRDIDFEGSVLITESTREVPIYDGLRPLLSSFVSNLDPDSFLFTNRTGGKMNRVSVFRTIKRIGLLAKVEVCPNTLRNSFARIAHDQGMSLIDIQSILGHRSLATTNRILESAA